MQRLRTSALALFAAVALAACGKDSTGPKLANGSFKAGSTGGVARSFSGDAIFGSDDTEEGSAFVIDMLGDAEFVILGRTNQTRPAAGTYALADISGTTQPTADQFFGLAIFENAGSDTELGFASTGGQLKITTSTATRMVGTFTMTGVCTGCATNATDMNVELSGSFNAISVDGTPALKASYQLRRVRVLQGR